MNSRMLAVVINLDRRVDRWMQISKHLEALNWLDVERVSAVDALLESDFATPPFTSAAEGACWRSHCRALERGLVTSKPFLILEDDAEFDLTVPWVQLAPALLETMSKTDLDVLQIGYLQAAYPWRNAEKYLEWLLAILQGRMVRTNYGRIFNSRLIINSFRAGAHAYIVSPAAAEKLQVLNNPAAFAADDLYTYLALNGRSGAGLRIGRLSRSLVGQASRRKTKTKLDSDIGPVHGGQ